MSKWINMDSEPFLNETMNIRELAKLNGFDEWMVQIPNSSLRRTLVTGEQKVTGACYETIPGAEFARLLRNSKTGLVCFIAQPTDCTSLVRWAKRRLLKVKTEQRDNGRTLVVINRFGNIIMPGGANDEKTNKLFRSL